MYEALCNHFYESSTDTTRDLKMRAKYNELRKRLASPEFLLDLGLMFDCLHELSVLSELLENRSLTLIETYINRTIRVLISFKEIHSAYMTETMRAVDEMTFKYITL